MFEVLKVVRGIVVDRVLFADGVVVAVLNTLPEPMHVETWPAPARNAARTQMALKAVAS